MVVAQRPRTAQKRLFSVPNWKCPDIIVSDVIMPESNGAIGQSDSSALSRRESFVVLR
jgi:hypothetical protein